MLKLSPNIDDRDKRIIYLKSFGKTNLQISSEMHLSKKRVDGIFLEMCKKHNCENSVQLVALAIRNNWID